MNKENINLTRSVSGITFRYDLLPSDVIDERAMDRIRGTMLDGVAPVQLTDMGGRKTIISNIPDGTALSMFLKRTLNKAEVLTLIRNLLIPFEIGKSGIPVNYIVKDWDNIFVDNNTLAVNVFLVPIQEATATVTDIADFFRDIVAGMKFNEADKDNYAGQTYILRIEGKVDKTSGNIPNQAATFMNGKEYLSNEVLLRVYDENVPVMGDNTATGKYAIISTFSLALIITLMFISQRKKIKKR